MAENVEELKSLLMKVKEQSEKAGLKLNVRKMKILTSSCITSWQIDGETMEKVTEFIFLAPNHSCMVTAAVKLKDTCSLKKGYDKCRQHIKNQRHYFVSKGPYSQNYGFPAVMYGCESWTVKNAEC